MESKKQNDEVSPLMGKRFELEVGREPHIQRVKVFEANDVWESMIVRWEIHKLEGGFVLCCGFSGDPKYVFVDESAVMGFLLRSCGTFSKG